MARIQIGCVAAAVLWIAAACAVTEARLSERGQSVRLAAQASDADRCTPLGKVVGYASNAFDDSEAQRVIDARNRAGEIGANLIVKGAATLLTVGGREFIAFRCPP